MREIYDSTAPQLAIYKASQMGASEYLISYAIHAADQRKATVLYLFPTDTHVQDFSAARIGPAIQASHYLDSLVRPASQRGADRTTLKRIRDRFLYLRGAKVGKGGKAPQLKAIDADVLILDEVDEMDSRAPAIAQKRLGHSIIAEERWVSTPTYHEIGIHKVWLASDQREWHVRCWKCGTRQFLTIGHLVREWDDLDRPKVWNGQQEGRAWLACRRCSSELNHLGPGEWVATKPGVEPAAYHLTKFFSPFADFHEIVQSLSTTDETKRRETTNQDLGLPYTPRGGQATDEVLDACRREYLHGPVADERTVMGMDVGGLLNVVIRGGGHQRYAGEVAEFSEVTRLMDEYNVVSCVVDALPETRSARAFQEQHSGGKVWLAYYVSQKTGTKGESPIQVNVDEGTVNMDRTRTLDEIYDQFREGTRTLPVNARDIPNLYPQLKAPVRVLKDSPGGQVAQYIETAADHYAHAENYAQVALDLINLTGGGTLGILRDRGRR